MSKTISIDARNPFVLLETPHKHSDWRAIVNDVITFFRKNPDSQVPMLPEPAMHNELSGSEPATQML
jgi:hypothetical protein